MRRWIGRERRDKDLDEEIAAHLAMAAEDLGSTAAARREFGNETLVKEVTRAAWGWGWAERFGQDLRYGARTLRKSPGFTSVVVLTLALGIGANTGIYSVMRAALAPMAVPHADRVVMVWSENPQRGWHHFPASVPDYRDWQASGVFASLGAFDEGNKNLRVDDRTERVSGLRFSSGVFEAVGIPARLGRLFDADDFQAGHAPAAILSDGLWRARFGSDPAVIGRAVVIDGAPHTIIGVLPPNFPRMGKDPLYTPLMFQEPERSDRGSRHFGVVGRLRDGVSLEAAQRRVDELAGRLENQAPVTNAGIRVQLQRVEEAFHEDARGLVTVLFGAVGFVLLIACANIASLVLARGSWRTKEMTIRAALGARGWRLSRQLLTENLLLALLGGAAAILPAWAAVQLIGGFKVEELAGGGTPALDWNVLVFNLALSLIAGMLFGLAPAWQARRLQIAEALKATARPLAGAMHQRLRSALVMGEIALTLVLLVGAGLMLRTFVRLRTAYPGYQASGVLTMKLALATRQYSKPEQQSAFFSAVLNRARSLPIVEKAGAIDDLPGTDTLHGTGLHFPDRPEPRPGDVPIVLWNSVTGDYFSAMGIPLLRGRYLTDRDRQGSPLVAVLDDWTAKKYWPNQDPVGKFFSTGPKQPPVQIVGIVGDVDPGIVVTLFRGRMGHIYFPAGQRPKPAMSLVVRTAGDTAPTAAAIRAIVRKLDPDQPVFGVMSMDAVRAAGTTSQQLASVLLGAFALLALLLAAIGIYGVVAYNVAQRTREFGIRMSLGAQPRDVLGMVTRGSVRLTAVGIGLGLAGALALTRVMDSLLYGVGATDAVTFSAVTVLLATAALASGYVPARRATRVDPVLALRDE